MKAECIQALVDCNREIEFKYLGRWYSITYFTKNGKKFISVCEFYKEPITVQYADQLLDLYIGKYKLETIFSKLPDSAFVIY